MSGTEKSSKATSKKQNAEKIPLEEEIPLDSGDPPEKTNLVPEYYECADDYHAFDKSTSGDQE
jgi:hypothetical protein